MPAAFALAEQNVMGLGNAFGDTLSVLLNKDHFALAPKVDYGTAYTPNSITSADFNADGKAGV